MNEIEKRIRDLTAAIAEQGEAAPDETVAEFWRAVGEGADCPDETRRALEDALRSLPPRAVFRGHYSRWVEPLAKWAPALRRMKVEDVAPRMEQLAASAKTWNRDAYWTNRGEAWATVNEALAADPPGPGHAPKEHHLAILRAARALLDAQRACLAWEAKRRGEGPEVPTLAKLHAITGSLDPEDRAWILSRDE